MNKNNYIIMKTIWTREKCAEEAAKYPTRTTFAKCSSTAYYHAVKNGSFSI